MLGVDRLTEESQWMLVFDGDCEFCNYCASQAARMVGAQVEFRPFQRLEPGFCRQNDYDYPNAIYLFEMIGPVQLVASGAGAAFKLRALSGKEWLWRLYQRSALFARFCECIYHWVSRHRTFCYAIARRLWPSAES